MNLVLSESNVVPFDWKGEGADVDAVTKEFPALDDDVVDMDIEIVEETEVCVVPELVEVVVEELFDRAAFIITSAAFSAMMKIGAWMKLPGIFGNTDASTTRRFCTPLTWRFVSSTAIGSSSAPIGQVHEA